MLEPGDDIVCFLNDMELAWAHYCDTIPSKSCELEVCDK